MAVVPANKFATPKKSVPLGNYTPPKNLKPVANFAPKKKIVITGKVSAPRKNLVSVHKVVKPMALTPVTIREQILRSLKRTTAVPKSQPLKLVKNVPTPTKDFVIPRATRPKSLDQFVRTAKPLSVAGMPTSRAAAAIVSNTVGKEYSMEQLVSTIKQLEKYSANGKATANNKLRVMSADPKVPGIWSHGAISHDVSREYRGDINSKTNKSTDLFEWANSDQNPVKDRKYVKGSYQCLQFASDFVKASREAGFDTYLVTFQGCASDGKGTTFGHAVAGLKVGDYVYTFDPAKGSIDMTDPKNWISSHDMRISKSMIDRLPQVTVPNADTRGIEQEDIAKLQGVIDTIPKMVFFEPQWSSQGPMTLADVASEENYDIDVLSVFDDPNPSPYNIEVPNQQQNKNVILDQDMLS